MFTIVFQEENKNAKEIYKIKKTKIKNCKEILNNLITTHFNTTIINDKLLKGANYCLNILNNDYPFEYDKLNSNFVLIDLKIINKINDFTNIFLQDSQIKIKNKKIKKKKINDLKNIFKKNTKKKIKNKKIIKK